MVRLVILVLGVAWSAAHVDGPETVRSGSNSTATTSRSLNTYGSSSGGGGRRLLGQAGSMPKGRRVLLHAAPGTGGSMLLFILAQSHDAVAFPNLRVPPPTAEDLKDVPRGYDVMLKVSMGDSNTSLIEAVERFKPDVKILLVRHPAAVASTLHWAPPPTGAAGKQAKAGPPSNGLLPRETVLRRLEWAWSMSGLQWDAVLLFEELLFNPAVARQKLRAAGFSEASLDDMDRMRRTKKDVERFNGKHCRWSRTMRSPSRHARDASKQAAGWDFGGASKSPSMQMANLREAFPKQQPPDALRQLAAQLCPSLSAYYALHHPELEAEGSAGGSGSRDNWLLAVQRLHRLVDDRAGSFAGTDATVSTARAHELTGSRVRTHLRERWVVLGLATSAWVRNGVALNWMAALHRAGVDTYLIVSLDLPAHESLAAVGAPTFFHETHYAEASVGVGSTGSSRAFRATLLAYKWKLVTAVLKRGVSVLLSDLDVVVLRDFRAVLDQSSAHIVAGRGTTKQLLVRLPFLLLRSCVEVLHLLPRLVATVAKVKDDEYALNMVLSGAVAWAEPPLAPQAFDHFVEGRTVRAGGGVAPTVVGAAPGAASAGAASGAAMADAGAAAAAHAAAAGLPLGLRVTLVPNRLLRLYECTQGHPAETSLAMHCANEVSRPDGARGPALVMTRSGRLVEPARPVKDHLTVPSAEDEGGEFAKLRLTELGLWLLSPRWQQQWDLIQSKAHRNTVEGPGGGTGPLFNRDWPAFKAWVEDVTAWTLPEASNRDGRSGLFGSAGTPRPADAAVFGSARKHAGGKGGSPTGRVSGHNLKRNCRHTLPVGLEADYTLPAIRCTDIPE